MSDYDRIAEIIEYITTHRRGQPSLESVAEQAGLSPFHFQRLFARWAGVTPKKFLQCLTVAAARSQLSRGNNVLDTALDVGLSGPGRLHDLTVRLEAASPGEIKSGGKGWTIRFGFAESPFGNCLIAESPRGICRIEFVETQDRDLAAGLLASDWPAADIQFDGRIARHAAAIFGAGGTPSASAQTLRCFVKGTSFQTSVWRALLRIPHGQVTTYARIAESIGNSQAMRAVGTAVAKNPIAYLIPCHRVIRQTGVIGEYRWGSIRKTAILGHERSRAVEQVGAIRSRSASSV